MKSELLHVASAISDYNGGLLNWDCVRRADRIKDRGFAKMTCIAQKYARLLFLILAQIVFSIAAVAQWIEYWPPKPRVVGSIPASRTIYNTRKPLRFPLAVSSRKPLRFAVQVQTKNQMLAGSASGRAFPAPETAGRWQRLGPTIYINWVLSLFCPGAAPGFCGNLLAGKQGAKACGIGRLALVQRAIGAILSVCVFGKFGLVDFGGIVLVPQRNSLRLGFLNQRGSSLCLNQTGRCKNTRSDDGLNDKSSTI